MSSDSDYKCSLDEKLLQKAQAELNEDTSTRLVEVSNLRKRLEKISGLKPKTDVQFLLGFLRARKFDQERTVQLIKNHYEAQIKDTDVFADLKPSRVKGLIEDGVLEVLEQRDNEGCRVIVYRPGKWDVDRYPIIEIMKLMSLVLLHVSMEEQTQVCGVHLVEKLEGLSWKQASGMTPGVAKKFVHIIQDSMPLRMRRIDMTHEPTFFDVVFALVRPFLKQKLIDRLHLNGTKLEDKLHKTINPEYLPTDLGGKVAPYSNQKWREDFLASDSLFEEYFKFGFVNMKVGKEDKKSADAGMSGLGGTFKKLDI